jgi:hypothetical protein
MSLLVAFSPKNFANVNKPFSTDVHLEELAEP